MFDLFSIIIINIVIASDWLACTIPLLLNSAKQVILLFTIVFLEFLFCIYYNSNISPWLLQSTLWLSSIAVLLIDA